jgi:hypothetical protein
LVLPQRDCPSKYRRDVLMSFPAMPNATSLSLLAFIGLAACRPITFCESDGVDCAMAEARARPDASMAEAGAGAGGDAGETECQFPLANCDESTLTGCETDLVTSTAHCGRCGNKCAGFCGEGRCFPFETVDEAPVAEEAGIVTTSEHVYFVTNPVDRVTVNDDILQRVSKRTGEVETVLESAPLAQIQAMRAGLDRLYFVDTGTVFSVGFSGLGLRQEDGAGDPEWDNFFNTPQFAPTRQWLYWVDEGAQLLRRKHLMEGTLSEMAFDGPDALLAGYPAELFIGDTIQPEAEAASFRLWQLDWPRLVEVAQGRGRLLQFRSTALGNYYLIAKEESSGTQTELYVLTEGEPQLLASGSDFTGFAVDDAREVIYVSFADSKRAGVRVVSRELGPRVALSSRWPLAQLECSSGILWFFYPDPIEPSRSLMMRLPGSALFER